MGGIAAARGTFVIMGDADDSYDFLEMPKFVEKLREGYDLVQGCRLPSGGGTVMPGAMPRLHRWWGNPDVLGDGAHACSGRRSTTCTAGCAGSRKDLFDALDQRCTGMEFATEMIIKSSLHDARIAEVPITLAPGRPQGARRRTCKTFRDGWRTLRFFLMYSPRWLFLYPGLLLRGLGLIGYALAMPGVTHRRRHFDAHTLLFASLAILLGYQSILFAIFAKTFAIAEGLLPPNSRARR